MQVAQKVGAADNLPEGVLFVDTPLPGQRSNQPLMFIGLALAALVAVTLLLSLAPDPAAHSAKGPGFPKGLEVTDAKGSIGSKPTPTPSELGPRKPPPIIKTAADMKSVLEESTAIQTQAAIAETINLETTGLIYGGGADQSLVLEAEESEHAVVRFQYKSSGSAVGLTVEGGREVVFRRINFQFDCDKTPDRVAAAVAIRGARTVRFEQCMFSQVNAQKLTLSTKRERVPVASVLIEADNSLDSTPSVHFTNCYFEGGGQNDGQVAVAINGPANVYMSNTAFKPHSAFFSFRDQCRLDNTTLSMESCTGLVATGPAFRFSKEAAATIRAQNCVFSRPNKQRFSEAGLAQPGLIYLAGTKSMVYEGRQNLYHALNDFAEYKGELIGFGGDYQKALAPSTISDVSSQYIDLNTTAPNPLAHTDPLHEPSVLAFQLKSDYARPDLGLQKTWLGAPMPKAAAPMAKVGPVMPKRLIVDPDDTRRMPGEFKYVAEALSRAKTDDVIEIKHGDRPEVEVLPVPLRRGDSVTLKAHEGFQPILVLDKKYQEKESALFKLQEGKLHFEQIGFLLDPGQADFASQSIVHLGEAAQCVFKQCVISLRTESKIPLSAVTFLDLERMMKMDSPAPPAGRVEFHECFVRGRGGLVSLRGCRLLHIDVRNSLVALDGSLLDITAADKALALDQGVRWKMERSSIFTTDSIFALRCMTGVGLTRTEADIKGCLLVSLLPEKPVVLLDMKNSELGKYLDWRGEQNFYANFDQDRVREWKDLFGETREFGKLGLPRLSDQNRQVLWDAELDWFRSAEPERIQGAGLPADAEKKLQELLNAADPP